MSEAKWLYDTADEYAPYICAACGESHMIPSDTCPNCGARMDGE